MKWTHGKLFLIQVLSLQEKSLHAICRQVVKYRSQIEASLSRDKDKDNYSAESVDDIFRRYSGKEPCYSNEEEQSPSEGTHLFLDHCSAKLVSYHEWNHVLSYIEKLQGSWQTPLLEELIRDRISPLETLWQNGFSKGKIKWACDAVDFYDELLLLEKSADVQDMTALFSLKDNMTQAFKAMGIELLRESSWNPETQRAISVEKTLPPHASPTIKEQGASGIRLEGQLIRKQEVLLQTAL